MLEEYDVAEFLEREVRFHHGVKLRFLTAGGDEANYGDPVEAAVIDEASDIGDEAYGALLSRTTVTQGPFRIIGNRRGRGQFYKLCRAAESGESPDHYSGMTVWDAVAQGIITQEAADDHQRILPPARWQEEYELQDVNSLNPFVGYETRVRELTGQPVICFGVDVARYPAYYAIVGLDADGHMAYEREWRGQAYQVSAQMVREIAGDLPVLVDATGAQAHCEQLRSAGVNLHEFQINTATRQELLERLAVGIASDHVTLTRAVQEQMERFTIKHGPMGVRYETPDKDTIGDDRVFALALAWWLWDQGTLTRGRRRRR